MITRLLQTGIRPRLLALMVGALAVTGCSLAAEPQGAWAKLWRLEVGPHYKRPATDEPAAFRWQVGPSEAASLADLPWWSVFNDQTLQRFIATSLVGNYDLQLAAARVQQARALVGVAAAPLYPHIGYEGIAGREKAFVPLEQTNGNITFNTFAGWFGLAWELDVWGRIRRSTEAARADLFAQEDVRRGVMLSLLSDVATQYFQLLESDRELAIAQSSSEVYDQTRTLFADRFHQGKDSKLPVTRAEAQYELSLANIAALKQQIGQQENAMSILLGTYPQSVERGAELTAQTTPATPPGLTTDLLQRRPDILAAEQSMAGANAQIGVAVANFFPRIGLSALYGGQAPRIGDVVKNSFSIWNVVGNAAGPIFQGGQLLEAYHAQQAFWDGTIAQYKQTILVALREVSDALIAQQMLVGQRNALERRVSSLRESVDLALLRYNAGRASYFEVLDAEELLFPAESALAQTQRDQLLAVVNLYKALGGGWNLSDPQWVQAPER